MGSKAASNKGKKMTKKEEKVEKTEEDFEKLAESSEEEFEGFESTDDEASAEEDSASESEEGNASGESDGESESEDESNDHASTGKIDTEEYEREMEKLRAQVKKPTTKSDKRGVIYIGRIPHGFYEKEMRRYFEQFGEITRLRLSRNKKTGKPKHYAFIEFKDMEVAKIAAETMNNYLLFGHILKVNVLTPETVSTDEEFSVYIEKLLIGANEKFKVLPWNSISKYRNDSKKSVAKIDILKKKEAERRKARYEKLLEMGIKLDKSLMV